MNHKHLPQKMSFYQDTRLNQTIYTPYTYKSYTTDTWGSKLIFVYIYILCPSFKLFHTKQNVFIFCSFRFQLTTLVDINEDKQEINGFLFSHIKKDNHKRDIATTNNL